MDIPQPPLSTGPPSPDGSVDSESSDDRRPSVLAQAHDNAKSARFQFPPRSGSIHAGRYNADVEISAPMLRTGSPKAAPLRPPTFQPVDLSTDTFGNSRAAVDAVRRRYLPQSPESEPPDSDDGAAEKAGGPREWMRPQKRVSFAPLPRTPSVSPPSTDDDEDEGGYGNGDGSDDVGPDGDVQRATSASAYTQWDCNDGTEGRALPETLRKSARRQSLQRVQQSRRFDPSIVSGFEYGIMTEEERRRLGGCARVTKDEKLCDANNNNMPITGGVNSLEMGTTTGEHKCLTCGKGPLECQGHPGIYVFPWPVFPSGQFLDDVLNELTLCCWRCGNPVLSNTNPKVQVIDAKFPPPPEGNHESYSSDPGRYAALVARAKTTKKCDHCDIPQPTFKKFRNGIVWNWGPLSGKKKQPWMLLQTEAYSDHARFDASRPFTAAYARDILHSVSVADWAWMGVDAKRSHPAEKIITVLLIPPPCTRPTLLSSSGSSVQTRENLTMLLFGSVVYHGNMYRKLLEKVHTDDPQCFDGGVPPDYVPEKTWGKRSKKSQDDPVDEVKAARDAMRPRLEAGKAGSIQSQVATAKKRPAKVALTAHGGGAFADAEAIIRANALARPTEVGRIRSLVELTRADAEPRESRMLSCCGREGAETMLLMHPKEYEEFQERITAYFVVDPRKSFNHLKKQRNGKEPTSGLHARFSKKKGFMRGHINGTRCDFSGRAVIAPAPCQFDIDEVGVPEAICNMITIPVRVTPHNRKSLFACVRRGPHVCDGATTIVRAGKRGDVVHIGYLEDPSSCPLHVGDVVHRHLKNGDPVIVGRQPTLHRASMLGQRTRRVKEQVIMLTQVACEGLNADFDGDEMNIHVPQTVEAQAEVLELMAMSKNFTLPQNNSPIVTFIQDVILAASLISRKDTFLSQGEAQQLLAQCKRQFRHTNRPGMLPPPAIAKPRSLWTGKQVLGCMFPEYLNLDVGIEGYKVGVDDPMDENDRRVLIQYGEPISGFYTKEVFGASPKGITSRIIHDGVNGDATSYMSDVQRMLITWMCEQGFGYHATDVTLPPKLHRKVVDLLEDTRYALTRAEREALELNGRVGPYEQARIEQQMLQLISSGLDTATGTMEAYRKNELARDPGRRQNGLDAMIRAGSKGKKTNRWALMVALGQTVVQGSRVQPTAGGMSLPEFTRDDPNPMARGMIFGNYREGLEPSEYWMHAMGAREGLAQTAVGTANVGYMHRRCVAGLEDIVATHGGILLRSGGRLVSSKYGGDGFDPAKTEHADVPALFVSYRTLFERCCGPTGDEIDMWPRVQRAQSAARVEHVVPFFRTCATNAIQLPIQPRRAIGFSARTTSSVTYFVHKLWPTASTESESTQTQPVTVHEAQRLLADTLDYLERDSATATLRLSTAWDLAPSRIVSAGLSRREARRTFATVIDRTEAAKLPAGEAVGIMTAQSVGETSTQMTLNVFHHAGQGNARVTMGVPRMKEIIDARKSSSMHTPHMVIPVIDNTKESVRGIASTLQRISLSDVTRKGCFVMRDVPDEDPVTGRPRTIYAKDLPMLETCARISGTEASLDPNRMHLSPWVVRIAIDPTRLREFSLSRPVYQIVRAIQDSVQVPVVICHSTECDRLWTIRIRIWDETGEPSSPLKSRDAAEDLYNDILRNAKANGAFHIVGANATQIEELVEDTDTKSPDQRGALRTRKAWAVETEGSSLPTVACMEGVDWSRTFTNDILEVEKELGVCSARMLIAHELKQVLTHGGKHVDMRHMWTMAASMCFTGRVLSLTHHGLAKMGTSTFHCASFEQAANDLQQGSSKAELDLLDTPTSSIVFGQMMPVGSMASGVVRTNESMPPRGPKVSMSALINQKNGFRPGVIADAKTGKRVTQKSLREGNHSGSLRGKPIQGYSVAGSKEGLYVGAMDVIRKRARAQEVEVHDVEPKAPHSHQSAQEQRPLESEPTRKKRRRQKGLDANAGYGGGGGETPANASRAASFMTSITDPLGLCGGDSGRLESLQSRVQTNAPDELSGARETRIQQATAEMWAQGVSPLDVSSIRVSFVNGFGKRFSEDAATILQ